MTGENELIICEQQMIRMIQHWVDDKWNPMDGSKTRVRGVKGYGKDRKQFRVQLTEYSGGKGKDKEVKDG